MECKYCGKPISDDLMYCDEVCEKKANSYMKKMSKFGNIYYIIILFVLLLPRPYLTRLYGIFLSSLFMILFPIPSAKQIEQLGLKKAKKRVRIIGLAVFAFSSAFVLMSIIVYGDSKGWW